MLNLALQQADLEQQMCDEASARMTRDLAKTASRGAFSESRVGAMYVKQHTQDFAVVVDQFMNQPTQEGRRLNRATELLRKTGIDPSAVAYLFMKAFYNHLPKMKGKPIKRVTLCIRLAELIHDEWRVKHFASSDTRKNLLKKLFKDFDRRQYPRYWRLKTIKNYFHAEQVEWAGWNQKEKLHVGYALLLLFRDSTGLVETDNANRYVTVVPQFLSHMQETVAGRVQDFMLYMPMVVPPVPWSAEHLFRGGYLSNKTVKPYALIKGARKRDVSRMVEADWSKVLPSINALQETAWRVNPRMTDLLTWVMDKGGGFAGLPLSSDQPLPPEPEGYRVDEDVTRKHNHTCFMVHDSNRRAISKRMAVFFTLQLAVKFKGFRAIHFPHNLDTRGRAYPLPAFLNPQGPDWCKSLLEFSRGISIDNEEQAAWLAVAGANAYGNDKVSLQERVDWVQDNDELIFSIATDPMSDLRWVTTSEPFQFVRFCIEWKAFWDHGYGYVSHMPVPVDATCSGLQIYAGLLKDEIGGRSVNLVPGLPRQDIYGDVATKTIEKLFRESSQFPDICKDWIKFGIDRKITKRQVMVTPYAGTFSSCMEYTREAVSDKIAEGHPVPWDVTNRDLHNERIVFLSKLIWEAIDECVVKGKEAMRWLSEAARVHTKVTNKLNKGSAHAKRMSWVTPDGFPAIHYRPSITKSRVETTLDGRLQMTVYDEQAKLSSKDMALALPPNLIHSLDGCHLRMSIARALANNDGETNSITDFAMVHDSFGVHAANMPTFLRDCVKPAFIEMYQGNFLDTFKAQLGPLDLPEVPQMGSLDITKVQDSEFFFS